MSEIQQVKIPQKTEIIVCKPKIYAKHNNQVWQEKQKIIKIIIKGKLGQYIYYIYKNIEQNLNDKNEHECKKFKFDKNNQEYLSLYDINENDKDIDKLNYWEYNQKHYFFDKSLKTFKESSYLSLKNENFFDKKFWTKFKFKNNILQKQKNDDKYNLMLNILNTSNLDQHLTNFHDNNINDQEVFDKNEKNYSIDNLKELNEKNIINELKEIFLSISQGYTINLQLNGIGYQGLIQRIIEQDKKKQINNQLNNRFNHQFAKAKDKYETYKNILNLLCIYNNVNQQMENTCFKKQTNCRSKSNEFSKLKICKSNKLTKPVKKKQKNIYQLCEKQNLILNLGFSHTISYPIPLSLISISCGSSTIQSNVTNSITIFGISHYIVNQIAGIIYKIKKPEPYNGKGIRYDGEKLFMKLEKKK